MGEWVLPYDAVRKAKDPDSELLGFFEDTYSGVAEPGKWRKRLVRTAKLPRKGHARTAKRPRG